MTQRSVKVHELTEAVQQFAQTLVRPSSQWERRNDIGDWNIKLGSKLGSLCDSARDFITALVVIIMIFLSNTKIAPATINDNNRMLTVLPMLCYRPMRWSWFIYDLRAYSP